jgi:hypothetical protein
MKKFRDYLTESERSYNYRIKMVGDLPDGFYAALKGRLEQFDPVTIGDQKSTPIQAKPADFPAAENEKVTSFDVKFRYPAIEPQIKQIAQLMGFNPNKIIMQTSVYDDSIDEEQAKRDAQPESLLNDTDYPAPDAEQKELYFTDIARLKRGMKNFDIACLEFIDDEIRLEELVYFCQNGSYPDE